MLGLYQSPVWSSCLPENDAPCVLPHQLQSRWIKHPNPASGTKPWQCLFLGDQVAFRAQGYGAAECRKAVPCLLEGKGAPSAQDLPDPRLTHPFPGLVLPPCLIQGQARCKQAGTEAPRSLQMDKGYKKNVIITRALALESRHRQCPHCWPLWCPALALGTKPNTPFPGSRFKAA